MPANGPLSKIAAPRTGSTLGARRSSLLVSAVAAVLAGVLIYVLFNHYSHKPAVVTPVQTNAVVFSAARYIPPGTPESVIASEGLLKRETVPSAQLIAGAVSDPSLVAGQVTTRGIAAGQQLSTADFNPSAKPTIVSYLSGDYRAVAFPLDAAHGLTAYLRAGARVDVMGQDGDTSEMLAHDVEVLGNSQGNVVLRLTDKQGLLITAATGKDSLWLSLRPGHGAKQSVALGDEEKL